ncbi:MAG: ribonuclease D [Pseudomonadota bacterium]
MKIITDTDELAEICADFSKAEYVTVDTEFLRERTYWSRLCLVQLARPRSGRRDYVMIDPLADGIDLAPLFELLADTSVVKVFHAARQDVEIFWNMGNVIPTPMFDTQVAAMVCGYGEQVGYETLVRKVAKAEVDKSSRFTDWSRRPLSDKQLRYALADVTHLRVIYETLAARIAEQGREHWVTEEMAILTDPATYETDPAEAWRRVKSRSNSPKFLAIVRELAKWREEQARERDIPRGRVMKDDALIELATSKPETDDEFHRLRLLQREMRRPEMVEALLAAVKRGTACPAAERPTLPPPPKRTEGSGAIADMLKIFLKARADEMGVAAKLIAPAAEIEALAGEDDPNLSVLRGWRAEVFGSDALRVKRGEVGLVAKPGGLRLVEIEEDAKDL